MKIILTLACLLSLNFALAQHQIGVKLTYGNFFESVGFGVKGNNYFNHLFNFSGELLYYPGTSSRTAESTVDTKDVAINIDAHYKFNDDRDGYIIYAIGGVHYSYYTVLTTFDSRTIQQDAITFTTIGGDTDKFARSYMGLNFGVGGNYQIQDRIHALAELKYVWSELGQLVFGVGVVYEL